MESRLESEPPTASNRLSRSRARLCARVIRCRLSSSPSRHCEPTDPARSGRSDDKFRRKPSEAIQCSGSVLGCFVAIAVEDGRKTPFRLAMTKQAKPRTKATKEKSEGSGTPADAVFHEPHQKRVRGAPRSKAACAALPLSGALACRRSTYGSRQRDFWSPRLSLGQASRASAPSTRWSSPHRHRFPVAAMHLAHRSGRSAGTHDAQAAREQAASPARGHCRPRPGRRVCLPAAVLHGRDDSHPHVTETETYVNREVTTFLPSS
jgi:hypothetical protein